MLQDLEAAEEISGQADRLLRAADAYGRFPTPVDDLVHASHLSEAADYVLDESLIRTAPAYLRTLLRSARHKIQGLLDRRARVIHVSPAIEHEGKRRFVTLHETTHHILSHQRDLLYADDHETLSPATRRLFEREANQGAAELLFQRQQFASDATDLQIGIDAVWQLATRYGSSFHAAIRRYAETHPAAVAAIVLEPTPSQQHPPRWRREETMASSAWICRFGPPSWPRLLDACAWPFLAALDYPKLSGTEIRDVTGATVQINVDVCKTPYHSFLLLWVPPPRRLARLARPRAVRIAHAGRWTHVARTISTKPRPSRRACWTPLKPADVHVLVINHGRRIAVPENRRTGKAKNQDLPQEARLRRRTVPVLADVGAESYVDDRDACRGEQP